MELSARDKAIIKNTGKLLESPENRTVGAYARTVEGKECPVLDSYAKCFCLSGALHRAAYQYFFEPYDCRMLSNYLGLPKVPDRECADTALVKAWDNADGARQQAIVDKLLSVEV